MSRRGARPRDTFEELEAAPPRPAPPAPPSEPPPPAAEVKASARRIGRYEILESLGEGPHAHCYTARDTTNDQTVVLKVLHAEALADPEKRKRFEQDALAVSAVKHPNIPAVIEIGTAEGVDFLAREYVEGETMHALLGRKRLRRRECVGFSEQIADALLAAHAAGIAHGGLRGSNIVVQSGRVKVLDFGFARLTEGFQYTINSQPRGATPESVAYLAPEQVEGQPFGLPADLFSFGSLLYQMATGRWAFKRDWTVATLDAILKEEPRPIAQVSTRAPRGVEKITHRCLLKDPHRRCHVGEVVPLLHRLRADLESGAAARHSLITENWERILRVVFVVALLLAIAGGAFFWFRSRQDDLSVRTTLTRLTAGQGIDTEPAFSPRGDLIAFASDRAGEGHLDIWLQPLNDAKKATRLTRDPADEHEPAFSPDGGLIAFRSEREGGGIYTVSVQGGQPRLIARNGRRPRFSPDGRSIAYWVGPPGLSPLTEGAAQIFLVDAAGGPSRRLHEEFSSARYPVWASDSQHILFVGRMDPDEDRAEAPDWWLSSLKPGAAVPTGACQKLRSAGLFEENQCAVPGDWAADYVIFSRSSGETAALYRIKLSPFLPQASEPPRRLTSGAALEIAPYASFDGRFLYSSQTLNADIWSVPVAADQGKVTGEPKRLTQHPAADLYPTLSSDGKKLLFQSSRGGNFAPWLLDLETGKETAATNARQDQLWPRLSHDGARFAFTESRIGAFEHFVAPVGVGDTEVLCANCGSVINDWSRDGKRVLISVAAPGETAAGIAVLTLGAGEQVRLLQHPRRGLQQARFSPDERWIAFVMRGDQGHTRVYLAPHRPRSATPPGEWVALTDGEHWETAPQFSPDGKLVYFTSDRDAWRCIWAQRIHSATGQPDGDPFPVHHMHHARRSPALVPLNAIDM
ncbi:MAG: PD40 domain-containing protein, partial [Acidobacteria bacterium]|nr:PD40 domain-containing protein [Acidobacteriota bacterium]